MTLDEITQQDRRYLVALYDLGGFASFKAVRHQAGIHRIAKSDDSVIRLHQGGYLVVRGDRVRLTLHGSFAARVWKRQLNRETT